MELDPYLEGIYNLITSYDDFQKRALSVACTKIFQDFDTTKEDRDVLKGVVYDNASAFFALVLLEGVGIRNINPVARESLIVFSEEYDRLYKTNLLKAFEGSQVVEEVAQILQLQEPKPKLTFRKRIARFFGFVIGKIIRPINIEK